MCELVVTALWFREREREKSFVELVVKKAFYSGRKSDVKMRQPINIAFADTLEKRFQNKKKLVFENSS